MKVSLTCWVRSSFLGLLHSLNILSENYFEMSHVDATEALNIYRHFCKQTDLVVEYLGVAGKLQNLLNVPIPHLKLVGALPLFFTTLS
jgi:ANTH domain